jgi:hypothetical protein
LMEGAPKRARRRRLRNASGVIASSPRSIGPFAKCERHDRCGYEELFDTD